MATDDKQKVIDSCPKQEVDVQDSCVPCGATACETEEDAGCDTCG
ncbi:MAG: hypothetical protein ACOY30_03970 [Bacillota bacterium]